MPGKIEIIYDERTGAVQFSGPLQNKMLCFGILETAKKLVADWTPPAVIPARVIGPAIGEIHDQGGPRNGPLTGSPEDPKLRLVP